jgi:hypothetical protein
MAFGAEPKKAKEERVSKVDGKDLSELFVCATELPKLTALKIGIWGRAKVGKTHFSMTNSKGKIFIIDTEGSAKVNVLAFPDEVKKRIFIFDLLNVSDLKEGEGEIDYAGTLDILEDVVKKVAQASKDEGASNVTIVIDSATDIWDWLGIWLDEITPAAQHIGKDKDKVQRLEWGKANKRYADIFRNLMRSGCNVIMTFRAKEAVGTDGANVGYFIPRWQKNTDYWIDVIVQIDKEGPKRVLRFKGGRLVDNVPELENPTWDKMCAHIAKHSGVKFE